MANLEKLQAICDAATVRDEFWSESQALFDRTFNPELVKAMLTVIEASNNAVKISGVFMQARQFGKCTFMREIQTYNEARERLDALTKEIGE